MHPEKKPSSWVCPRTDAADISAKRVDDGATLSAYGGICYSEMFVEVLLEKLRYNCACQGTCSGIPAVVKNHAVIRWSSDEVTLTNTGTEYF